MILDEIIRALAECGDSHLDELHVPLGRYVRLYREAHAGERRKLIPPSAFLYSTRRGRLMVRQLDHPGVTDRYEVIHKEH